MKTGSEVESDFYKAVLETELAKEINGAVYRSDFRPRNSKKEDVVVRLTAVTSGQLQYGVVTLLVFVPDVDATGQGHKKRNSARICKLEQFGVSAVDEIRQILTEYDNINLETGVDAYPDDNEQHFVSIRINFSYLTDY